MAAVWGAREMDSFLFVSSGNPGNSVGVPPRASVSTADQTGRLKRLAEYLEAPFKSDERHPAQRVGDESPFQREETGRSEIEWLRHSFTDDRCQSNDLFMERKLNPLAEHAVKQQIELVAQAELNKQTFGHESELEMFKSIIATGQTALRTAILVNGGAAVATLAFMGNLLTSPTSRGYAADFAASLLMFTVGVLCPAVATGITYLCQKAYRCDHRKFGHALTSVACLLVVSGYALFLWACLNAYRAFSLIR